MQMIHCSIAQLVVSREEGIQFALRFEICHDGCSLGRQGHCQLLSHCQVCVSLNTLHLALGNFVLACFRADEQHRKVAQLLPEPGALVAAVLYFAQLVASAFTPISWKWARQMAVLLCLSMVTFLHFKALQGQACVDWCSQK